MTGAVAASVAQTTAETAATATPGPIALSGLPAEATADTTLPAGLDLNKPQAQVTGTQPADSQVKPQDATQPSPTQQQSGRAAGAGSAGHAHAAERRAAGQAG